MSRARDLADRVLHNRTHEDTDGGRESILTFKGEQSGGEISTLAQIQASHDGTSDDEKADLIFKTNDGSDGASPTEAMRITSQQRVGIGTNDPSSDVEIASSAGTLQLTDTDGTNQNTTLKQSGGTFFIQARDNADNAAIVFAGNGGGSYDEHLRILPAGGITFNGDTAAANALDDYEEGTFNATFSGATVSPTSNVGAYTKIGNMVYWRYYTQAATISSSSGALLMGGLPFTIANDQNNYVGITFGINTFFGSSTTNGMQGYHQINTDYIYFVNPSTISSPNAVNGSSKYLMVGGFYKTNS